MRKWPELLLAWSVPHTERNGTTLVARADAVACLERVYLEGCRFYGYDSFTISPEGWIQPFLEWSPSWEAQAAPPLAELVDTIRVHPPEITHYEFVFESAA